MASLTTHAIRDLARQIVLGSPKGIRFNGIKERILQLHPETPEGTILAQIATIIAEYPEQITKPSRGLYMPVSLETGAEPCESNSTDRAQRSQGEEAFYRPFADWLEADLDEVTAVASLGGAGLGKKWGTPDVVGVYKPRASDRIKFPLEIVAAEIKSEPQFPVVAFGQAAAYRLFAAKAYVVMPTTISEEDLSRLEALAMLFGIGLVVFDPNPDRPEFRIRVRAQRFSPDMFYVNEFADRLRAHNPDVFEELFA